MSALYKCCRCGLVSDRDAGCNTIKCLGKPRIERPISPDGWDNPALRSDLPKCWQELQAGVGIYIRMPDGREPLFLAGIGKQLTVEDIRGAINFLTVIMGKLDA